MRLTQWICPIRIKWLRVCLSGQSSRKLSNSSLTLKSSTKIRALPILLPSYPSKRYKTLTRRLSSCWHQWSISTEKISDWSIRSLTSSLKKTLWGYKMSSVPSNRKKRSLHNHLWSSFSHSMSQSISAKSKSSSNASGLTSWITWTWGSYVRFSSSSHVS